MQGKCCLRETRKHIKPYVCGSCWVASTKICWMNIYIYMWKLWIPDTSTVYPSNKDLGYGTYHTSGPQIRVGHNRGHHQVSEDVPKVRILGRSTVLLRIIGKQPPIYCILQMETWKIIKSGGKIYLYIYIVLWLVMEYFWTWSWPHCVRGTASTMRAMRPGGAPLYPKIWVWLTWYGYWIGMSPV